MRSKRFEITAPFLLCAGLLYFFDTTGLVSAAVPAVAAHELGHVIALKLCRCRITRLRLALPAFSMDYSGVLSRWQELFAALAGPIMGLFFSVVAYLIGKRLGSEFLLCSADISLLLSAFNLLPVSTLDGGRTAVCVLGARGARVLSAVTAALLIAAGTYILYLGYGAALMLCGAWMIILLVKNSDLM